MHTTRTSFGVRRSTGERFHFMAHLPSDIDRRAESAQPDDINSIRFWPVIVPQNSGLILLPRRFLNFISSWEIWVCNKYYLPCHPCCCCDAILYENDWLEIIIIQRRNLSFSVIRALWRKWENVLVGDDGAKWQGKIDIWRLLRQSVCGRVRQQYLGNVYLSKERNGE